MDNKYKSFGKAELGSKDENRRRSRSPQQKKHADSSRSDRDSYSRSRHEADKNRRKRSRSRSSSSSSLSSIEDKPAKKLDSSVSAPPPPKISVNLKSSLKTGIKLRLVAPPKPSVATLPKLTVASAFNDDSEDEIEEMPAEAKMRMKNIGKNTPTSSGPNSFGKTKQGFVDSKKMFEKKMQQMLKDLGD